MSHLAATGKPWRRVGGDIAAGVITAVVFYPEYLGLAAVLAAVLPGSQATAMAGMLVLGAVVACCLASLPARQPMLSGPRAASLAVMVGGVKLATAYAPVDARLPAALLAMSWMLAIAGAVQLLGLHDGVKRRVKESHPALRKGFMYASAVGISAGVSGGQLESCLRISAGATAIVFALSVGSALAWSRFCNGPSNPTGAPPSAPRALAPLAALSTLVGMAISVAGYYLLIAQHSTQGVCATLGTGGLQLSSVGQLIARPGTAALAWAGTPAWLWMALALGGVLLGSAMLLETLTALVERPSADGADARTWSANLKASAVANLLGAPLGLACGSVSLSRSNALHEAGGRSALAVFCHALSLMAILLGLSEWIGRLPQLSVATALMLVAIQMIDKGLREDIWSAGYAPGAAPTSVRTLWLFWLVLGVAVGVGLVTRSQGWGLSLGVLVGVLACAAILARRNLRGTARAAVPL